MKTSEEKAQALAKFLEVELSEITEVPEDEDNAKLPFVTEQGYEYMVLTDEEADEKARDYILDSLWAFNADFIISHCKGCAFMELWEIEEVEKGLRQIQENICEGGNGLIKALISDIDEFVDDAINADGRGHFMSSYDGEEHEQDDLFIYRMS